jgi:hypothetical protein
MSEPLIVVSREDAVSLLRFEPLPVNGDSLEFVRQPRVAVDRAGNKREIREMVVQRGWYCSTEIITTAEFLNRKDATLALAGTQVQGECEEKNMKNLCALCVFAVRFGRSWKPRYEY